MSIAINEFSDFAKIARALEGVSDKTQISLEKIGGWPVTVGRFDRGQAVRNELLKSLNATFGGTIPESVLEAMNVSKAFSGFSKTADGSYKATNHPLTVRRLRVIVKAAQVALDERANEILDTPPYSGVREQVAEYKLTLNPQDMLRVHKGLEYYGKLCGKSLSDEVQRKVGNLSPRKQLLIKALVQDEALVQEEKSYSRYVEAKINGRLPIVDAIDKFVTENRRLPDTEDILAMLEVLRQRQAGVGEKYMKKAERALDKVSTGHLIPVAEGLKTYDEAEKRNCIPGEAKKMIQNLTLKQQALIKALVRPSLRVPKNNQLIPGMVNYYLGKLNAIEEFVDRTGRLPDHVEVQGMRSESKK